MYFVCMRYYILSLCMVGTLLLSGCGRSTTTVQDATQAYQALGNSLFSSHVFKLLDSDPYVQTGIVRESFGLYSESDTDTVWSTIQLGALIDTFDNNVQSSIQFSGSIQDKKNDDTIGGFGLIYSIKSGNKQYINRKSWTISLWANSAESILVQTMLQNISSQRLLLDDTSLIHTDSFQFGLRRNLPALTNALRVLFQHTGFIQFSPGNSADTYSLSVIDTTGMNDYFSWLYAIMGLAYTGSPSIVVQWYMDMASTPRFVIETLKDNNHNRSITGSLSETDGSLSFMQDGHTWMIQWTEKKQSLILDVSYYKWEVLISHLSTTIVPKIQEGDLFGLVYHGDMTMNISWKTGVDSLLTFPIAGKYTIHIVDKTQFKEPLRYILMSQVFGDAYGIANLLEKK